MTEPEIIVIEDDVNRACCLQLYLELAGYTVQAIPPSQTHTWPAIEKGPAAIVYSARLPGYYLHVLAELVRRLPPDRKPILVAEGPEAAVNGHENYFSDPEALAEWLCHTRPPAVSPLPLHHTS